MRSSFLRLRRGFAPALFLFALAGCGATPPQVPKPEVHTLSHAIGQLGLHCGDAITVTAFGDRHGELRPIDRVAQVDARELVSVLRKNPKWIYQGETVDQIARDESTNLTSCGLEGASATLSRATGG